VQNASHLVFNSSAVFEASGDQQQALLLIEDVDRTRTQSSGDVQNFYLDSSVSWPGIGHDKSW